MLTLTSPFETWAHRRAAGEKLAALAVVTTALFLVEAPWVLAVAFAATVALYLTGGLAFARAGARQLWPLWPFVGIVGLWHLWTGDVAGGAAIVLRMVAAVAVFRFTAPPMTTRLPSGFS